MQSTDVSNDERAKEEFLTEADEKRVTHEIYLFFIKKIHVYFKSEPLNPFLPHVIHPRPKWCKWNMW